MKKDHIMSERSEFVLFINRLKAVSPTITEEQRKGLLRQATQEYEITTDEADEILRESGLIVGDRENYFTVFGLTVESLDNMGEDAFISHVKQTHKELYAASLRAGGLPRSDGRTQEQWRNFLNQARDIMIDPIKRRQHTAMLLHDMSDSLSDDFEKPVFDLFDIDETTSTELSHQVVPNEIDVPDGMVYIPTGEFEMGSDDTEANEDESPVHTVLLDAFLMDKYPVTNVEYMEFLHADAQQYKPEWLIDTIKIKYHDGGYLEHWNGNFCPYGKDHHPVTGVSWYAAMAYAQWAGKRLPTEAEWEKAARGRLSEKKYPWGDSINTDDENYQYDVNDTISVGRYPPNRYGLYDMCGNVWEWCLDTYYADYYESSPSRNPFSDRNAVSWVVENFRSVKDSRVLRGGPWGIDSQVVRVSHRFRSNPIDTLPTFGFRCVMDVTT